MNKLDNATIALWDILNAALDSGNVEEWWKTSDPHQMVVEINGRMVRVTVEEVPPPDCTPADVDDGLASHPYGWTPEMEQQQP